MLKTIETEQLRQRIGSPNPPLVLEALPERYYLQKHLPGAQLFPHDQVAKLAPIVAPDVTTEIVVYCASRTCQNSRIAAQHLIGLGYRNVAVYEGGKVEWEEGGMPFESGAPAATVHEAAA
jgi:rhodanese-related sulfurtransferase